VRASIISDGLEFNIVGNHNTETRWGPDNPHPLSRLKTELVWEGKYDEYGNRRTVKLPPSPLPLQRIETIDEPRDHAKATQGNMFNMEAFNQKAHCDDFRNMLIWGDNKLALAALLEQFRGKVDLIYIDPPFDVGADFSMQVQFGEEGEQVQKEQSILEAVAYRDTWGKGTDSYLHMMYERVLLMRDLLNEQGSIYVHCDTRVNSYLRCILEEVFGPDMFQSEIVWKRADSHNDAHTYGAVHDTLLFFSKRDNPTFTAQYVALSQKTEDSWYRHVEEGTGRRYNLGNLVSPHPRPNLTYEYKGIKPPTNGWRISRERMDEYDRKGLLVVVGKTERTLKVKQYLDESRGRQVTDWWDDISQLRGYAASQEERTGFETQKPEALLNRVIKTSTGEGGLVADIFCGSGTTLAVAEKLGRRWIGCDLSRYAIHTTRKRMIQVQRELHEAGKPYRSFDVYNLGRYERQWWQLDRLKGADEEHRNIVLKFYKATPLASPPSPLLHGKKNGAYVHVDKIDGIFTEVELNAVAEAAQAAGGRELHCLAWEFEMELALKKQAVEAITGLDIKLKYIPREIMEPNRTECQFFEAGYLEAKAVRHGKKWDVALVRFSPSLAEAPEEEMAALRQRAVSSPFDFIDFWAVDFDWHDDKPFEHHWQDFRTRKDRSLKTTTDIGWEYSVGGKHRICVKVIDVFGVDTTIVIDAQE